MTAVSYITIKNKYLHYNFITCTEIKILKKQCKIMNVIYCTCWVCNKQDILSLLMIGILAPK